MTTICVDVMGADKEPAVLLEGVASALADDADLSVLVAGAADVVEPFCASHDRARALVTTEVITMSEHPAQAVRAKKDASIVLEGVTMNTTGAALFPAAGSPVLHLGDEVSISSAGISAVLFSVYVTWLVTIAVRAARSAFKHPFVMLNGIISNTRIMSVAQADRLRTARHEETLAEELHELDIDPLGTDLDDAFDSSFDTTSADEGVDFDPEEQGYI